MIFKLGEWYVELCFHLVGDFGLGYPGLWIKSSLLWGGGEVEGKQLYKYRMNTNMDL